MTVAPPGRTLFLTAQQAAEVRERFGAPCYVYDRAGREGAAKAALAFPAARLRAPKDLLA